MNLLLRNHQIQPLVWRMSRLTRDGTVELVSRNQILRPERGTGKISFSLFSSADHEQGFLLIGQQHASKFHMAAAMIDSAHANK